MSETLPEGWAFTTLGDLSTYVTSGSRDWSQFYSDHGALFIRTQDINQNRLVSADEIARVALPKQAEGKRTLVTQGDLLITITGANVGKCAHVDIPFPEAYVSQSVALVRLAKGFSGRFVQRQLISPGSDDERTPLQQSAYGVGRPVLNLDNVRDAPIVLAPFREQERIVAKIDKLLSEVNSARDHLSRIPAILKRFRQAVLAAACSGKLTEEWRGSSAHNWKECTLAQIVREPLRNGHSARASLNGSGVRTLTLSAVTYGDFSERNTKLTVADPRRVADLWLLPGDILIERSNSRELVGTARLYQGTANFAIFPDLLIRVRVNEEANPAFLEMVLQADSARNYFISSAQGTQGSMPKIDQQTILDFPLELPPMTEQKEIVQRVTVLLTLASKIEERINAAIVRSAKLTQSILAKAFRGELVPTEAELARRQGREYEPASVLLERIKKQRESKASSKPERKQTRTKVGLAIAKG